MPCNTIQRSSVNLELRADNKDYLMAALRSLGFMAGESGEKLYFRNNDGLRGEFVNGKLNVQGPKAQVDRFEINSVKRAYSVQVVQAAGKKFGWQVKQTSENNFSVLKRGF